MIIGFIGFGKVSGNLVNLVNSKEISFITSDEGRSPETIENITKSDVKILDTFREVVAKSDIVISATSPKNALAVAKDYAGHCKGIYLDLNNISPSTTFEIARYADNLVDGAIIGKIDSDKPVLYLSGKCAGNLLFFNEFIETHIVSDRIGDASTLKLLRSTYTKTLSAVLIESYNIAKAQGLESEFFEILSLTEGEDFKEKSLSRIENTLKSSKRKSEELQEIMDYFDGNDLGMVRAAFEKLNR